jgi:hypothetical protein
MNERDCFDQPETINVSVKVTYSASNHFEFSYNLAPAEGDLDDPKDKGRAMKMIPAFTSVIAPGYSIAFGC